MPLLKVNDIISGYGDMQVLNGISMMAHEGEVISIVGPNGSGKSTLMKTIFGLIHPWDGSIEFNNEDISLLSPDRIVHKGMCYVPQVDNVFPSLTVEENLEMGAFILNGGISDQKNRVFDLFPGLSERRKQRVGKMSGGERQMVAMGRALMLEPQLLLLDEPSAGLAPKLVDTFFEQIMEINKTGVAIIMVEQNARKSLQLADRGYVMATGQVRYSGSGEDLLNNPKVAELYLGG